MTFNRSKFISRFNESNVSRSRKKLLDAICLEIVNSIQEKGKASLNFICTHNSRRSQMSHFLAAVFTDYFNIELNIYSGGTEITAVHENVLNVFRRIDVPFNMQGSKNPKIEIGISKNKNITLFSKKYNNKINPTSGFIAIMTCDDAYENCPVVYGAQKKVALVYEDPKVFDTRPNPTDYYIDRFDEIGREMWYLIKGVKEELN